VGTIWMETSGRVEDEKRTWRWGDYDPNTL
jgi:hypothetical protein